jgi:hypothetical protein
MQDSVEPSPVSPVSSFPLPDAGGVTAAWSDPPPASQFPPRLDKAKTVSGVMLALGAALMLFVPLGGALFLVAGGLGLAISSEAPAGGSAPPSLSPTDR